ncbi:MAG: hypothetical protein HQK83_20185 [Fibrobacteria bacterium]|nr:hypothetical protein [Fibrobacteria bacterium]
MINLSKKAADRFKTGWRDLPEQQGDFWKIDILMVQRFPVILIIHEYTLYTLVRLKKDFKKIEDVAEEIKKYCPWYRYVGTCTVGKNGDRCLNGSINDMKRMTGYLEYYPGVLEEMESRINTGLFSALSLKKNDYGKPVEVVEMYKAGQWPAV